MSTIPDRSGVSHEALARYEPVIGLEVHVQLATRTKAFCSCSARFGDPPNSNTCPVCLGLPGALPVLNRAAVEMAIRAALAFHCMIHPRSRFARKNYFYPDLPKGYQISQYELPLATSGWLEIEAEGVRRRIGITRLHMEEDSGKSLHEGLPDSDRYTYIDLNRCGVPLIEIVSEPDLRAPAEAYAYLTTLKQVLEYIEVSDCDMEKGSLRCDANVSVRLRGAAKFGTKTEVKNLNSFRYLQRALEYEIERQVELLENGGTVVQETRLYNVATGRTEPMRSKEFAHDYRYFPDPDLLPLHASPGWVAEIERGMPELPDAKARRFLSEYGVTPYDVGVLTSTRALADYFEDAVRAGDLAELLALLESGKITAAVAKKVFAAMFETGRRATDIVAAEGLGGQVAESDIERAAREIIAANPDNVAKYRKGNQGVFKFFVGQVMRATRGQANPQAVAETLKRLLAEE